MKAFFKFLLTIWTLFLEKFIYTYLKNSLTRIYKPGSHPQKYLSWDRVLSLVPRLAASASLGKLLGRQILGSYLRPIQSETGGGPGNLVVMEDIDVS